MTLNDSNVSSVDVHLPIYLLLSTWEGMFILIASVTVDIAAVYTFLIYLTNRFLHSPSVFSYMRALAVHLGMEQCLGLKVRV